ncbi:MAG: nuclear transport factor 2 family protein [Planctomycetota bacterium]
MRHLLVLLVALATFGGCTMDVHLVRDGDGAESVAAAIARAWQEHFAAAHRKDAIAACAIYADDATYAVAGQPELRGRVALAAMEAAGMQSATVGEVTHFTIALRVDGERAHEIGTVRGDVAIGDAPAKLVVFEYVAVWRRQGDGAWRIAHLHGHMATEAAARPRADS